jgi:hypothetical protein
MHRLGNLTGLPAALAPVLVTSASAAASTISLPSSGGGTPVPATHADNPWGALHMYLLPLFNGEPLRVPMYVSLTI